MDEIKNQTYVDYIAKKELEEEQASLEPSQITQDLSMGERLNRSLVHFWSYYKWYAIVAIAVIVIIVSVLFALFRDQRPLFEMIIVNAEVLDKTAFDDRIDGFNDYMRDKGLFDEDGAMTYKDQYRHPLASEDEFVVDNDINSSTQKLASEIRHDLVDVMIMNTRCVDEYCDCNGIEPLTNLLTQEEIDSIDDEYLYRAEIDGQIEIVGIRIEGLSEFQDLCYREGDTYVFAVSSFSSKKDISVEYLRYILSN